MKQLPRLSEKEEIIMQLLSQHKRELYGLEMVEASHNKLKRGTVYVTLARMEDKGYLSSRKEETALSEYKTPRRLYKLTGLGKSIFDVWQIANQEFLGALS